MNAPAANPALDRLNRLESYLQQDPHNLTLVLDAFDTALQAGSLDRAEFHLRHGLATSTDDSIWRLREVHWLLAQHRWDEARAGLLALAERAETGSALALNVAHDLGYVALRTGRPAEGIDAMRPLTSGALPDALQALWLRLLHRQRQLDEACQWAREQWAQDRLSPPAAGVASLAALDAGLYEDSLAWADQALARGGICTEALVARASLALAQRDASLARQCLDKALAIQDNDGRTWSAVGFCELLEQRLPQARVAFDKAVATLPEHIGTWHGMGWAAVMSADLPAAQKAFDTALALDRNFAESHGGQAVVLALTGRREEAEAAIERALRLDRASLSARYAQAVLSGQARDTQALQTLARRLLGARAAPLGGTMADVVVPDRTKPR